MRKKGSNGQRLDAVEHDLSQVKRDIQHQQEEYNQHIRRHVIDDLQAKRYNEKPLYSYADIASRHQISTSAVQRIAIAEGLTRRNKE